MLQALVLAAQALVVLDRAKDLGAEQAIAFRLERPVVDRFRLLHFTVRPRTDLLGRGEADLDRVELLFLLNLLKEIEQCFHCNSLFRRGTEVCSGPRHSSCGKPALPGRPGRRPPQRDAVIAPISNDRGRCRYPASGFPSPAR
ncbi:hypothetical protein D3C85_1491250 [compost metagenome]